MKQEYSVTLCKELEKQFQAAGLHRPMRIARYEPGAELAYEVTTVAPANKALVRIIVDKFIGGGFAGQVYRVKVLEVQEATEPIVGLKAGSILALKIMVPPSGFSQLFRNIIYGIGFQGAFQLQVNPAAARAGALWQKFIRRGAKNRFGDEKTVVDILATFIDQNMGSCAELSEWVQGRTWRLEVDDRLDLLKRWRRGKPVDEEQLGSPEYRAKRLFMADFVKLLHEMGAPEFARQYEWSTCKSQPNCLKRCLTQDDPAEGLTAVDFRAGLALLPFLPMSPGDFKLIGKGLLRGSLVQFDRGSLKKLKDYIDAHPDEFADMHDAFEELRQVEKVYRDSIPDITHNHVRLLYSRRLWSTILNSCVTGWRVRNIVDDNCRQKLRRSRIMTLLFMLAGIIPFFGKFMRRLGGRADFRHHYFALFTNWGYLGKAVRARITEKLIHWHRAGRINKQHALQLNNLRKEFFIHLLLSFLPAGLHRMLTDRQFAREKLDYIFIRPLRLYFNAEAREQWLREMVKEGKKNHLLTDEDAGTILGQINEPFIQKYLKSLAVHVCTLPVTQIVSVIVAAIYYFTHLEDPNAWAVGMGIIAAFQVVPISPGSICRGAYVVYLVIRERNFKDYNIAVFLGFFKYVGYLAFPIQMAYRYPVLARFMAAHWATGAVHVVPVFGERGALLEHGVFSTFYNLPLTIRRRMQRRAQLRDTRKGRNWHVVLCALAAAAVFIAADAWYLRGGRQLPEGLKVLADTWWLIIGLGLLTGSAVTLGAAGATLGRRIAQSAICGVAIGILYGGLYAALQGWQVWTQNELLTAAGPWDRLVGLTVWRVFILSIFSVMGAILTELKWPEPKATHPPIHP